MEDSLNKLQKKMFSTYSKNLQFLEDHDNNLYHRILELSDGLDNGLEEKYTIDYENDKLNIIDVQTENYLYENEPYYDAQYKCSKFYPNSNESISLISTQKIEKIRDPKYSIDSFEYINEYIRIMDKKNIENTILPSIGKYVFIGTLLGIHISKLHEKIRACNYLIIEESLEIFRLSLFFCNYKKLSKNSSLFFIVNEDTLTFREILRKFLKTQSQYNHFLKYSLASNKYMNTFQTLSEVVTLENPLLYTFSDYLGAYGRGVEYIRDEYKILNFTKLNKVFKSKPVLYIGPGPSLSTHIKFIKKSKKKFVIICLASSLKLLSNNDIVPDVIISIDASTIIRKQFDVPKKYYYNSLLLVSSKIDKQISKKLNKKNLYMVQDSIEFFENFGILRGNSSGELGYSLCCHFNIKELYLIGMDVSLNQKTKSTHDESYYINKKIQSNEHTFLSYGQLDFDKDMITVRGNFQEKVYTTRRYLQLIYNYNKISQSKPLGMKVYNLSEGAYLDQTVSLEVEKIKIKKFKSINKKKFHLKTFEQFDLYSKNYFNKDELSGIKEELLVAGNLLKHLKNCINKGELKTFEKKLKQCNISSFIVQIINLYYELLNPYKNIVEKNKKIHQKLNMIQLEQIRKILEFYICKIQIK